MTDETLNHYETVAHMFALSDPWLAEPMAELVAEVRRLREELAAVDALAEESEVVPGAFQRSIIRSRDLVWLNPDSGVIAPADVNPQLERYFNEKREAHVRAVDDVQVSPDYDSSDGA